MTAHPAALFASVAAVLLAAETDAASFEIRPSGVTADCNEEFENVANALKPGDELILHDGEYWQSCRRAITVRGTADRPIVIRAAAGARPVLTRAPDDVNDNNIEIAGAYVTLRGLVFRGGSTGVRFFAGHHVTFADNEVFNTANNAVTLNSGDTDAFVIRNNHIHHTGLAGGRTEGEGLYVGCHSGSCVASNHLIEGNHIHDLRGTSSGGNDGVELKYRSHGNVVRGNVIHDTNIGTAYPCVFSYGGGDGRPNVIENNLVYGCGEAILVTADTVVRNNVILDSASHGIHARAQQPSLEVRNVAIVNNTVYGSHPVCAQLRWRAAANVTFANNALFCPDTVAVRSATSAGAIVRNNYASGAMHGARIDGRRYWPAGAAGDSFVAHEERDFHLREGSALIDAGAHDVAALPCVDHDGRSRLAGGGIDVGAFEFANEAAVTQDKIPDGCDAAPAGASGDAAPVPARPSAARGADGSGEDSGHAGGGGPVSPFGLAAFIALACGRRRRTGSGLCI